MQEQVTAIISQFDWSNLEIYAKHTENFLATSHGHALFLFSITLIMGVIAKSKATPSGSLKTVLIIDDDPLILKLLKRIVRPLGVFIHESTEVDDGYKKFQNLDHVDLIITDNDTPYSAMTGIGLTKKVRDEYSTPIIHCSGEEIQKEAIIAGANDALRKPVPADTVREKIRKYL